MSLLFIFAVAGVIGFIMGVRVMLRETDRGATAKDARLAGWLIGGIAGIFSLAALFVIYGAFWLWYWVATVGA